MGPTCCWDTVSWWSAGSCAFRWRGWRASQPPSLAQSGAESVLSAHPQHTQHPRTQPPNHPQPNCTPVFDGRLDFGAANGPNSLVSRAGAAQVVVRPAATAGRARPAPANAPPVTLGGAAVLAVARLTDGVLVLVDDVLGGDAALNASAVMVAERLLGFGPLTPAERAAMFSPLLDYLPATPRSLLQGYGRLRASVDAGRGADAPAAEAPLALVYVPPFGVAGVGGGGRGGGGPDVAGRAVMRREAPAPDAGRRRRQALEAGATVVDAAAAPYQPGDIPTTTTQAVPEGDAFAAVWIGADPVASAAARGVVAVGGRQGGEVHAASSTSPRTPATWPLPTNVTRPADDAALAFLPVLHLAALLRARTLTSTELTEVYLERLARWAGVGGFGVWGACAGWTGRCGLGGRGRLGRRGAGRACRRPPGAQTALTPPRAPQPSCSCPTTGPAPTLGPTHPAEHGGAGLACRVSVPTLPAPGHPRYHHPPSLLPFTNHSAPPPPPPSPASYLQIRRNAGGGGNADARPGARPGSGCRRRAGRGRVAGPPARHPVRPEGCHLPGWLPHDVGRRPLARPRGGGERRCRAPPGRRRRGARGQAGHRGAGV